MTTDVDVVVVGRGLIGSAAARHLAEAGHRVALVGSGEPADYDAPGAVFASHYDAGRITRISSVSPIWSELAARSIRRYDDIAARSGIAFHVPAGLAHVSSAPDAATAAVTNAINRGGSAREVTREWLYETTGIAVRPDHPGGLFFEDAPAGTIAPRKLVAAQTALAVAAGAVTFERPATAVRPHANGVVVDAQESISASRVLLATGAYGAALVGVDLRLEQRLRTIVLAELGPGEDIPSFIDEAPADPNLDEIYWVPPRQFPDGRTMLKIGGDSLPCHTATSSDDIAAWFRAGGSETETAPLQSTVRSSLPDAHISSWGHKPCVVTYTPRGFPAIGFVDDNVAVAVGGCGAGAKSSDEIGRLAAERVMNDWTDELLAEADFAPLP